jgi:hypothetical protein
VGKLLSLVMHRLDTLGVRRFQGFAAIEVKCYHADQKHWMGYDDLFQLQRSLVMLRTAPRGLDMCWV